MQAQCQSYFVLYFWQIWPIKAGCGGNVTYAYCMTKLKKYFQFLSILSLFSIQSI